MSQKFRKIIVVLGMHRSGTSAVTRGLTVLGVDLGDNLIGAISGDNDRGFWEDAGINSFNERLLQKLGSSWHSLAGPTSQTGFGDDYRAELEEAGRLLEGKIGDGGVFAFKDPRMSILLPFWQAVMDELELQPYYLLIVRNPLEVAASLEKRNGFSRIKGVMLWARHVLEAMIETSGQPRIVVSYENFLLDPEKELGRVSGKFGLESPQTNPEALREYIEDFLSADLRRNVVDPASLADSEKVPPFVRRMFLSMRQMAEDQVNPDDPPVRGIWQDLARDFRQFLPLLADHDSLSREVEEISRQVEENLRALSVSRQEALELQEKLSRSASENEKLRRAVAEFEDQGRQTRRQLDDARLHSDRLEGELKTVRGRLQGAEAEVQSLAGELAAVYASNSWKLAGLFRYLRRALVTRPHALAREILSGWSRRLWHNLPGSTTGKLRFKGWIFTNLPWLFNRSAAYRDWRNTTSFGEAEMSPDIRTGREESGSSPRHPPAAGREYVPLFQGEPLKDKPVRVICFYLPQFHAIPENDAWWGEGFTEWTNVRSARPQFVDHYQPHEPGDLGYYNLLEPEVQRRQVELARLYGIGGFCFYFYWFAGKRLLEKPLENYLADPGLDLPFCLCWANENWSRRWDGLVNDVLIAQQYSAEDDLAFIAHVARYLRDPRYIRIDGRPLLLVYRPNLLPSAKETSGRWRRWCRENGIGEIYLAYTQSFENVDPSRYGFDAAVEFPPNNSGPPNITESVEAIGDDFGCTIYDWQALAARSEKYVRAKYPLFRGVNPAWDNTPRRRNRSTVLLNSSPGAYQRWLLNAINDTRARFENPDERLVFINAWNEWAEGAYLEPDRRYGYAWLEATRLAQVRASLLATPGFMMSSERIAIVVHAFYVDVLEEILGYIKNINLYDYDLYVTVPRDKEELVRRVLEGSGVDFFLQPLENRGRDVLPFLKILPTVIAKGHEILIKVHTKKSLHRQDGASWRRDIYERILVDERIEVLVRYLRENPTCGILGPENHLVPMSYYWGSNSSKVEWLSERLGIAHACMEDMNFVAGTMFVARVTSVLPILNLAITDNDFEEEGGQVDGTLAHALERAFAVSSAAVNLHTTCYGEKVTSQYQHARISKRS